MEFYLLYFTFFANQVLSNSNPTIDLSDLMCFLCPPGQLVLNYCNSTHATECGQCPNGTFSSEKNNRTFCNWCQTCKRLEFPKSQCTSKKDTECSCPEGSVYDPVKPCTPCKELNQCDPSTTDPGGGDDGGGGSGGGDGGGSGGGDDGGGGSGGGGKSAGDVYYGAIAGISLGCVLVILLMIFACVWFYKRRKVQQLLNIRPDVVREAVSLTPPLPPKKFTRTSNNDYTPTPLVARPITPKKINIKTIPFSLVQELNDLLHTSCTNNYKTLAGELGYTYGYVRTLERERQPVETLLGDYISGEDATKEKLYEALIKIRRLDAAQKVWDNL